MQTTMVSAQKNGGKHVDAKTTRPVQLDDRVLLLGTEKGIEPPLSVSKACLISRGWGRGKAPLGGLLVPMNP